MTHISSKKLKPNVERELYTQFMRVVAGSSSGRRILNELLTDVERLMLAKRIAILFMVAEGVPYYRIRQALGISTSTTRRLHDAYIKGEYKEVETFVKKKAEREKFWNTLEVVLRAGLPPQGKGRWKRFYASTK